MNFTLFGAVFLAPVGPSLGKNEGNSNSTGLITTYKVCGDLDSKLVDSTMVILGIVINSSISILVHEVTVDAYNSCPCTILA